VEASLGEKIMTVSVEDLIRIHQLGPHPEGGYFRETYRSAEFIPHGSLPARYKGDRAYLTGIYYLLPRGAVSHLHRIASDEMWHFYLGGPLRIVEIGSGGLVREIVLGPYVDWGQQVQHVVKAGVWFGAYPEADSEFAFVGCTVAPGFDFADFELGRREELLREFPSARQFIEQLTRE
jgi:predicted cupin superfamily sugar epimerase